MNKSMNLQDVFLNQARREKIAVTIFLTNGFQFKGTVKGFEITVISFGFVIFSTAFRLSSLIFDAGTIRFSPTSAVI